MMSIANEMNFSRPPHNPVRSAMRVMLAIAAAGGVGVVGPLVIYAVLVARGPVPRDTATLLEVIAFLALPLTIAMLISAAATRPTARHADRLFEKLAAGDVLASWTYPAALWRRYTAVEQHRLLRAAIIWFFLLLAPISVIFGIAVFTGGSNGTPRLVIARIAVGCVSVLSCLYLAIVGTFLRMRFTRLRNHPTAFIAQDAIYFAGALQFWGTRSRALDAVHYVPAPQPTALATILFTGGGTRTTRRATSAANIAMAVSGNGSAGSLQWTMAVPVPPGEEALAQSIVKAFTSPE